MTPRIHVSRFPSPIGPLSLATMDNQLVHLDFDDNEERMRTLQHRRYRHIQWSEQPGSAPRAIAEWLEAYFDGVLQPLPRSHIRLTGTDFQQRVWQGLIGIPAGEHRSYGALAEALGNPKAVRAVARANALNPVAILIPCHRVIGANGTLTGYAGGLERKAWLLNHEAANLKAV
ncbi:methylated-DNA--[protein]-cysteine S-methyltransferase [Marinobacter sp. ATCH36]|uniref:methylated-DNA--[protein]-cysteine S-methyltransferase n=1 Tax=Marinobacter sp. ATCH36 TaxID=2945106 RepID=UPI0024C32F97|nr:methylated-DNA--[protein]-cysteine S-methyltransferase [Marinobacter sp. ATCH36]